ncbi:hypothetical protein SPOG_02116 [Schizosaccharomyces cryophilus OY26]|uniref:Uncharacterized protein n=1 Tax=Schizosaccharomyces cryophilus (strain OY26 / ATCC MYA-4695 / CBS 11777 / NBRC 106824 / NRRL Y48691) TaxID=653667 RepID=S9X6T7_SCHCR|nr:uncharacterized protein SPOG_02116 [Schizosaccharomyces cryophilus OY26]EPY52797.1 hypothetical protein SPOG_02116 [Schizosaccharomyces cryophilus OY26]
MNIRLFNRVELDSCVYNSSQGELLADFPNCNSLSEKSSQKEDSSVGSRKSSKHHRYPQAGDLTLQLLQDTTISVPLKFKIHRRDRLSRLSNKRLLHANLNHMLSPSSQPLHNDDDFAFLFSTQPQTRISGPTLTNNSRKTLFFNNFLLHHHCANPCCGRVLTNRKSDSKVSQASSQSLVYYLDSVSFEPKRDVPNYPVFEAADSDHPLAVSWEFIQQVRQASSLPSPESSQSFSSTLQGRKSLRKRSSTFSLSDLGSTFKKRLRSFSASISGVMYRKNPAIQEPIEPTLTRPSNRMTLQKLNRDNWFMEDGILHTSSPSDTPLLPWNEVLVRKEMRRPRLNSDFFRVYVLERQMRRAGKLSVHSAGRAQFISHPKPSMMNMFSSPLQIQL